MTIPAAPVSLLAVQAEFGKNMPTTFKYDSRPMLGASQDTKKPL